MDKKDKDDFFIQILEVFINSILYVRNVYPKEIFQKQRVFNTIINISIHPLVNSYIKNVLKTAKVLKMKNQLEKIEIILYEDKMAKYIIEKYTFVLDDILINNNNDDKFLIGVEANLKNSLLILQERCKHFKKLQNNIKFQICLHTTEAAYIQLSNDKNNDFLWINDNNEISTSDKTPNILPLVNVGLLGLEIYGNEY